jgi:hypothetical protein
MFQRRITVCSIASEAFPYAAMVASKLTDASSTRIFIDDQPDGDAVRISVRRCMHAIFFIRAGYSSASLIWFQEQILAINGLSKRVQHSPLLAAVTSQEPCSVFISSQWRSINGRRSGVV